MLRVISTFNPDELAVFEKCQKLHINPTVVQQIQCIDCNLSFLIDIILQLEGNLSLWNSVKLLDFVCENLSDPVSKAKFDENMAKNPGLTILSDMVKEKFSDRGNMWNAGDRDLLDRVPIQNCFVERSFSRYKDILSCRRQSLTKDNIAKYCFALVTLTFSNFAYKLLQNSIIESTYFLTYSTHFRHILYNIVQIFKHILLSALLRTIARFISMTSAYEWIITTRSFHRTRIELSSAA